MDIALKQGAEFWLLADFIGKLVLSVRKNLLMDQSPPHAANNL